jgi:uncharacterized protein (TIGR03083 family)
MAQLEHAAYVDAIEREERAMLDAAAAAGLETEVPSCPGWTVGHLIGHVGRLNNRWSYLLEHRSLDAPVRENEVMPPDALDERPAWVLTGLDRFLVALRSTPPDTPVWTFGAPPVASFYARRMAHETAMHRVDTELAASALTPVDRPLALDGVDEFLEVMSPMITDLGGGGRTMHLHATDPGTEAGEGEWLLRLDDTISFTKEHAKGDVAVRGSASDLLLLLTNRLGADSPGFEIFGDSAVLDLWRERAKF